MTAAHRDRPEPGAPRRVFIRVAVADDSPFIRKAVARMLEADPALQVVGTAATGEELLDRLEEWRPDVVTLDLSMPGMGGLATLDRLMESSPLPVIILSTFSQRGAPVTIEALHRGAVDFIDKGRYSLVDFSALGSVLVEKIRRVAAVRPALPAADAERRGAPGRSLPAPALSLETGARRYDAVLIGASTGGPLAVQRVLADLEGRLPVPLVVVQHMPPGFTRAFAERLNAHLELSVREASEGETLLPGTVYIAPGGEHLRLQRHGGRLVARLGGEPRQASHRPSVDVLFESAAEQGGRFVALILTGMGSDGARGMAALAAAGAWTVAQDRDSCVVFGMPRAAEAAGGVRELLPLERIGERLRGLLAVAEPAADQEGD